MVEVKWIYSEGEIRRKGLTCPSFLVYNQAFFIGFTCTSIKVCPQFIAQFLCSFTEFPIIKKFCQFFYTFRFPYWVAVLFILCYLLFVRRVYFGYSFDNSGIFGKVEYRFTYQFFVIHIAYYLKITEQATSRPRTAASAEIQAAMAVTLFQFIGFCKRGLKKI